jgi:hypothetical protein
MGYSWGAETPRAEPTTPLIHDAVPNTTTTAAATVASTASDEGGAHTEASAPVPPRCTRCGHVCVDG